MIGGRYYQGSSFTVEYGDYVSPNLIISLAINYINTYRKKSPIREH